MQDGVRLVLGAIQRGWGAHDAFCEDGSFASRTIQPAPHLRDDKCKHVCNVCDSLYVCLCKSLKLFERALVVEDREKERGGKGKGGREGEAAPRSLSLSLSVAFNLLTGVQFAGALRCPLKQQGQVIQET